MKASPASNAGWSSSQPITTAFHTDEDEQNANTDFFSRLQLPPTMEDISGPSAFTDPDDLCVYLIRACGYITPSCQIPAVVLNGFAPSPTLVLGGLPLTKDDFRTHRAPIPTMRMTGYTTRPFAAPTEEPCLSYAVHDPQDTSRSNYVRRT